MAAILKSHYIRPGGSGSAFVTASAAIVQNRGDDDWFSGQICNKTFYKDALLLLL